MSELKTGSVCELRNSNSKEDWQVIDRIFNGDVYKYIVRSRNTGETKTAFRHELFEKGTSTYKELNEFFEEQQGVNMTETEDGIDTKAFIHLLDDSFENYLCTINASDWASILSESASGSADQTMGMENIEGNDKKRFKQVTSAEVEDLKSKNTEKSTKNQTKWAVKLLKDWLLETGKSADFEMLPVSQLDALLEQFYTALQSKTGEDYLKSSLVSIRSGLNRHLTTQPFSRQINIMRDREFMSSNQVFSGKIKTLRKEGKDISKNKDSITEADLEKLYNSGVFSEDNPTTLQNKVTYDIICQFGRRGREGLSNLRKNSFTVNTDSTGIKFVQMAYNEADKNHKGVDNREQNKQPRMYADESSQYCPVRSFEKYISKLNPQCESFFQRPLTAVKSTDDIWYSNVVVGVNKLYNFMPRLSKEANLSTRYTNHCLRATVSSRLHNAGFSDRSIMSVTGHRNPQSLQSYIRPSENERKILSSTLNYQGNKNAADPSLMSKSSDACISIANTTSCDVNKENTVSSSVTGATLQMNKSVDMKVLSELHAFHVFSGNISSSTINIYQSFDKS